MTGKWSDFTEDARRLSQRAAGCSVTRTLEELPKAAREAVRDAISRPELTTISIVQALQERGVKVSYWAMTRHRRGTCPCPTDKDES